MDTEDYWGLIERSGMHATDLDTRATWLVNKLSGMSRADIVEFKLRHAEVKRAADTWPMWGAAYLICEGWCSEDAFWYFQSWLIGLDRETYERATADPDTLADASQIQRLTTDDADMEPPEWELLDYVADQAYERATGEEDGLNHILKARGVMLPVNPEPPEDGLDEGQAERARRLPRLMETFPPAETLPDALSMEDILDRHLAREGKTREEFFPHLPTDQEP
ncbi:DUF4240 domain-containing protein [Sphaerisporangium album]|uniref:DUF4240 domain-containing protein n=1 Tax=Sphaerisporangium album TaxID=509200 RepID=A0A367FMP4_9ACTN|nr:DUF4240 domain-containing protein [Sphaerisporangium album]RCG31648.1 DUF4240 domain-containing protein [Sphaerisporangium album]